MSYMNINKMNQMNFINEFSYEKNFKTVKLFYKGEFIQNVDINYDDN